MSTDERKTPQHEKREEQGASSEHVLDEQVDQVIRDIEANSSFMLRKEPDAEMFDPDDFHPDDLEPDADLLEEDFAGTEAVDELPESIEVAEAEEEEAEEELTEEEKEQAAERHRRRLRTILTVFIVILVLIAAIIGVFIWQGSLAPDVEQSDTEALTTSSAGTGNVTFAPVQTDAIPQLAAVFGKTAKQAQAASDGHLTLEGKAEKAADKRVKAMTQIVNGKLVDENGTSLADVGLGLDKKGKVVYVYCSFDLDALEVADATFGELAASDVVPRSLLEKLGVGQAALQNATLSAAGDPAAVTGGEADAKQQAVFKGSTGGKTPSSWQVTETYDRSVGQTLGDNSVMRTLLVELY